MPIKYAAIYLEGNRVAEQPAGGYPALAETCQRLADKEIKINKYNRTKLTDDAQGVDVNYLATGRSVLIVCVSSTDTAVRTSFDMLGRVEAKCRGDRQDWPNPSQTLKHEMEYANDPRNDIAKKVQGEIAEIQDIMMENMDKMLDRHDKLEGMVAKSDALANEGETFFKRGRELRRKMCCQQAKMTFMLVAVVLVIILIIVLIVCKPNFSSCS
eukprot:TRINITY_DN4304_c1_g1_i2.p1 TRINITY_DN4304_c1_g1~~TRINITY_DN4304_c1_g1_i2.p1  ORF type:complete len:232 (+),score=52.82 TRINITY_DN4304_c1_g1_i2:59-697(+)